jgi:4-amino-4-deoxy-L-arabinose transferase-like glycosyltransferase
MVNRNTLSPNPSPSEGEGKTRGLLPAHILIVALLLAAFLRFWRLDSVPGGLYHDEAYYGLDALSLLDGKTFPIFYEGWELYANDAHAERPAEPTRFPVFFEGNYGREPLHVYLIALSIKLWGATPFAIRFVTATAGTLAVLTTYLAAGAIFGGTQEAESEERGARSAEEKTSRLTPHASRLTFHVSRFIPAFAALALAVLYPAITFSRFGIRAMDFVPVETMAVYCFWKGITAERRSWLWLATAGFFLGLGLYTYAAARLLPLLFVLFVPLWFWLERPALRRYGPSVGLMALMAAVTAGPLLLFFTRYPYFFIFRTGYVANKGLGAVPGKPWLTWLLNIGRVFAGLFWQGEGHLRHNLPGRPYLDGIQALFFAFGVGATVWQGVRWPLARLPLPRLGELPTRPTLRALFLLIWLGVMLLPTLLSGDAPHFGRMTGAAPVVAILIGVGAGWLLERVGTQGNLPLQGQGQELRGTQEEEQNPKSKIQNLKYLVLVLFLISGGLTFRDYFGRYASHPELAEAFYVGDWELGQAAAAQPADTMMYLTPTQEEMATIYYALAGERERLHSYQGDGGAIPAGRPDAPALYLVRLEETETLAQLAAFFPAGTVGEVGLAYVPFSVPADAPRTPGLTAAAGEGRWGGQIRLLGWKPDRVGNELAITLVWQAEAEMERPYTAFVHLLDEEGTLLAQLDRPPAGYPTTDWREGEVVADRYVVTLPAPMASGNYRLMTGWYYLPTLERLEEAVELGRMVVE